MLTSRFGFGYGLGYAAYSEAMALVDARHSVTVVHCNKNCDLIQYHDPRITFYHLPIKKIPLLGFFLYTFQLKSFLKTKVNLNKFDVVYIQSLEFGLANLGGMKLPIYYFARSTMIGQYRILRGLDLHVSLLEKMVRYTLISLERKCMRYSKTIFVKSPIMVSEVSSLYGINEKKIAVINGGIDVKDFQLPKESSVREFKTKLGIPPPAYIVLYAGRIVPQKGLILLIRAALNLLKRFNFVVVIAGETLNKQYFATVKRLLDGNMYQGSFYFLGHIDQWSMPVVLNAADCLVTPSLYEPFGMINLQAASLGKNIITTDVTGSVDLLANYKNMKVVKAGSSDAIESTLEKVLLQKSQPGYSPSDLNVYSWGNVANQLSQYFSLGLQTSKP